MTTSRNNGRPTNKANGRRASNSKRSVIYPVKGAPCPVRSRVGNSPMDSAIYRYKGGSEASPRNYTTDDGFTLADLVDVGKAPAEVKETFRKRRFRSKDTMMRMLNNETGVKARDMQDGNIIAGYGEDVYIDRRNYDGWKSGMAFRFAEVDDPSSDSPRNLYVKDESDIPGRILRKDDRTFYDRLAAEYAASDFGRSNADRKNWKFSVTFKGPTYDVSYADALKMGYDGRDMEVDESMDVGPLVITRIREPNNDYFAFIAELEAEREARKKNANGSKQRKPKAQQPRSANGQFARKPKGGRR